jgi:glutaredoxin
MRQLILYSTPWCHLCDEAETLLHATGMGEKYQKVDIDPEPELLERYGVHIPVLKREDNQKELFWPFDQSGLNAFLGVEV